MLVHNTKYGTAHPKVICSVMSMNISVEFLSKNIAYKVISVESKQSF